jgi:ATP synthase F1 complex assembly factor 1
MAAAARRCPQFVLPVPDKDRGAEIHFLQWTFDDSATDGGMTSTVLFTQLAEYKARGEFAQPHTTITHHLDLAEEKGIVLMQGTVMEDRGIAMDDSRWLVMCLQKFYGGWDGGLTGAAANKTTTNERVEERRNLLEWFRTGDARFSVEKLMEEAERLG